MHHPTSFCGRLRTVAVFGAALIGPMIGLGVVDSPFALAEPAKTAAPAPAFAAKNKFADISITFDDTIKARPALAENLLAEGKKWADGNRRDADKEGKTSPESFRNGPWTFERSYATGSVVAQRYVSIIRTDFIYTGGAHPNTGIQTILWDDTAAKQISIRPFFKNTADNSATLNNLKTSVIKALRAEKKARGIDDTSDIDWYKDIKPTLLGLGPVTLAPSTEAGKSAGLIFHFEPYAVGPYAEGSFHVLVPWNSFAKYLTPEGSAIFAGAAPPEPAPDKAGDK